MIISDWVILTFLLLLCRVDGALVDHEYECENTGAILPECLLSALGKEIDASYTCDSNIANRPVCHGIGAPRKWTNHEEIEDNVTEIEKEAKGTILTTVSAICINFSLRFGCLINVKRT